MGLRNFTGFPNNVLFAPHFLVFKMRCYNLFFLFWYSMSQNWRKEIMVIQNIGRLYLVNRKDAGTHGVQQVSYVWMWQKKLIVSTSDTWSWKCFLMQVKLYKCSPTNYCYLHPETCRSKDFSHTHMSTWCHWILFQLILTNASVKMEAGNLAWTVSTSTGLCSK